MRSLLLHARRLNEIAFLMTALFAIAVQAAELDALFKRISPAVLVIEGTANGGHISASGFLISKDGKVATNVHVIRDIANPTITLASGEKFDRFSVIAYDEVRDLAIIKIPGFGLPTVRLGDS